MKAKKKLSNKPNLQNNNKKIHQQHFWVTSKGSFQTKDNLKRTEV